MKIEGRGRSPEYTKVTVSVYREAVDALANGTFDKTFIDAGTTRLRSVYNRDFWDGYYLGRKMGEWTRRYGSQATKTKIYVGIVTNYFAKIGVAEVKMETNELSVNDDIMIIGPTTGVYEDVVREIRVDLEPVKTAEKGVLCSLPVKTLIRRGDKVYKIVSSDSLL